MGSLEEYLLTQKKESESEEQAYLLNENANSSSKYAFKNKDDYILNASKGTIIAFRLNFKASSGVKLTKVISGKIIINDDNKKSYKVETKNGLEYMVPYSTVLWVKTGNRWPRGVYEEMRKGAVALEDEHENIENEYSFESALKE